MNATIADVRNALDKAGSDGLDAANELQALAERFKRQTEPAIQMMESMLADFKDTCKQIVSEINAHTERIKRGIL